MLVAAQHLTLPTNKLLILIQTMKYYSATNVAGTHMLISHECCLAANSYLAKRYLLAANDTELQMLLSHKCAFNIHVT